MFFVRRIVVADRTTVGVAVAIGRLLKSVWSGRERDILDVHGRNEFGFVEELALVRTLVQSDRILSDLLASRNIRRGIFNGLCELRYFQLHVAQRAVL